MVKGLVDSLCKQASGILRGWRDLMKGAGRRAKDRALLVLTVGVSAVVLAIAAAAMVR